MNRQLREGLAQGVSELGRWTPVLDRINVFPVADGDTGRNLILSLSPLTMPAPAEQDIEEAFLLAARGNSGNIASQFLSSLLGLERLEALPEAVSRGCARARGAIADPQPGTMLTLFDGLREALEVNPPTETGDWVGPVVERISESVLVTRTQQERLHRAGVVDAGALGLWIVLERCLRALQGSDRALPTLAQRFGAYLTVKADWREVPESGFCVDAVLRVPAAASGAALSDLGESTVAIAHGGLLKIHVHGKDADAIRRRLAGLGEVVHFESDDLGAQWRGLEDARQRVRVRLLTDAAGTFTADDAAQYGVTVLDSYILLGEDAVPESALPPQRLYAALASGERVTTSQASTAERHAHYRSALEAGKPVLYLAVGSVFTGNVTAARQFIEAQGCADRFGVVDSGAASGRLGIVALSTARLLERGASFAEARSYAQSAFELAEEWVFLDQLKFLARGGRLSRTAAFFGDTLHMKPVISPRPTGAEKVGVVRHARDQLPFLLARLEELHPERAPALFLLQHTDNEDRLREEIVPALSERYPEAELLVRRLSLTSGVHMGPGTWALAALPEVARPPIESPAGA